jgi:DNA-binding transcriptional LysR family regulator
VRTLERELDVRLFDRTTHRLQLTSAGRLLLPEARRTLVRRGAPVLTISLATVARQDVSAPCRAVMSTAWGLAGDTPD